MSSELKDPQFHARLEYIIGKNQPFAWADKIGIPKGTFSRVWNEGTVPGPEHLKRIQEKTGYSIDWLLTGEGEMLRGKANGHVANGHNNIQGAHIDAEDLHLTVIQPGAAADPGIKYMESRQNQWFHDWIDEVLRGKSISDIMDVAVKLKQIIDKRD